MGSPEIDQHDFAPHLSQINFAAIHRRKLQGYGFTKRIHSVQKAFRQSLNRSGPELSANSPATARALAGFAEKFAHIPMDAVILEKWLRAGFVENRNWFPTEAGTPQGGIASPTLANMVLDGLEQLLDQTFRTKKIDGRAERSKIHLIRYADDFVITGPSREVLANEVRPLVEQFLRDRGLDLSAEKSSITHIDEGFDFLGQEIKLVQSGSWLPFL